MLLKAKTVKRDIVKRMWYRLTINYKISFMRVEFEKEFPA